MLTYPSKSPGGVFWVAHTSHHAIDSVGNANILFANFNFYFLHAVIFNVIIDLHFLPANCLLLLSEAEGLHIAN
jgi:hypothetical protein